MTAEKAIEILSGFGIINRYCAEDAEVLDMAIKALEQQPCEDAISRKQALKETKALIRGDYNPEYIIETLKMLPSVTPKAEQKAVLGKIKAEIEQKQYDFMDDKDYDEGIRFGLMLAYQTVDKYKTESEG